ncbi:MAG: DUF3034 family protein [Kiritimatiellae bacterium]|nr:DUF3034 family protein [Kiritimatiellia bacterium]MBP5227797.1 DUF3034 family protein [Kiritimatiellia bacterium]
MNKKTINSVITVAAVLWTSSLLAGVPLNNLQGTGGIAFNPLAYTAGLPWGSEENKSDLDGIVTRPQVGAWYVNLGDAGINWWAGSAAATFAERLELSYGYGFIDAHKYGDDSISTHNVGLKLRFLDENAFDTAWVPSLAVGTVWKYTDSETVDALGLDDNGFDAYVVATKLITQTPVPVLVSAGLLLSDEVVNGVVGHNEYDVVAFGNLDILPAENVAIGVEYKQGVDAGDGIRNHDYYDAHVAWFVTKQLTLVAAFAETGDKDKFYRNGSAKNLGVGSGAVFAVQYQF